MQAAFVLMAIVLAVAIALLRRSRADVSDEIDSAVQGVPDDLRNKFSTHGYVGGPHAGAGGGVVC